MRQVVTVGLDGSPESAAAADWAAGEAQRRAVALRLLHVVRPRPGRVGFSTPTDPGPRPKRADRFTSEVTAEVRAAHPDLSVTSDEVAAAPVPELTTAADDTELLVLGSRGRSAVAGFFLGSVARGVIDRIRRPVVLVPVSERTEAEDAETSETRGRDVVLGLDVDHPSEPVIEFAFEAAADRAGNLLVIHSDAGGDGSKGDNLTAVLEPWVSKFPQVNISDEAVEGDVAHHLVDAAENASLLVIGHHITDRGVGPVSDKVLQHAVAPVAVVPHDGSKTPV